MTQTTRIYIILIVFDYLLISHLFKKDFRITAENNNLCGDSLISK